MKKEIKIVDYAGNRKNIVLEDVENISLIKVEVRTGDEVLRVKYKDGHKKSFDSCPGGRIVNFYDGEYELPLDRLDEFAKCEGSSYDRMSKFSEA